MKSRTFVFSLLLLFALCSPVWALFCTACGVRMADEAKFCAQCGKASGESPSAASPAPAAPSAPTKPARAPIVTSVDGAPTPMVPPAPPAAQPLAQSTAPAASSQDSGPGSALRFSDDLIRRYDEINRFEAYLLASSYYHSMSRANEFRRRIKVDLQDAAPLAQATPVTAKLHSLYLKKATLLDQYHSAWGDATLGPMKGQAEARKSRAGFLLERTNDLILQLREATTANETQVLARVQETERQLEEATREYRVTSKYLKIGDTVVSMGQPIWIMQLQGNSAKIMYMAQSYGPEPVMGWVSISDLLKRTDWRREYRTVECLPAPQPTTTVVVVDDDRHCWPRRHPYPIVIRFPFPGRGHDHDRHDRHDRDCRCDRCRPSRGHGRHRH